MNPRAVQAQAETGIPFVDPRRLLFTGLHRPHVASIGDPRKGVWLCPRSCSGSATTSSEKCFIKRGSTAGAWRAWHKAARHVKKFRIARECDFPLSNLLVLQSSHRPRLRLRHKNIKLFKIEQTLLSEAFSFESEGQKVCCAADQFINFTLSDDGE